MSDFHDWADGVGAVKPRPMEYYADQHIPDDFAVKPDLVANLIISRIGYLLERVLADGHNPLHGDLTVTSTDLVCRFLWAQHE